MRFEEKIAEVAGLDQEADDVRLEAAKSTFTVDNEDDVVFTKIADDKVVVSYLAHDHDHSASNVFDNDDGAGVFKEFRSQVDRDAFVEEAEAEGKVALVVNRYKHGNVHYSVQGSRSYPDMQWDVAPCAVHVPCDDVQEAYRNAMLEAPDDDARTAAYDALVKDSNTTLDEYSKACNGEVYGAVHETWKVSPDGRMEMTDQDSVWGLIGHDYALETMKGDIPEADEPESPSL